MTEGGTGSSLASEGGRNALGLRLALMFLGVALAAVAVLAGLTAAFASADVAALAARQRTQLTTAISVAAGAAWDRGDNWSTADLSPVLDAATNAGADVQIRTETGQVVQSSAGFYFQISALERHAAVHASNGVRVGTAVVRFSGSGLGGADHALLTALLRGIAGASGLAALLALVAGLGLARRISQPIVRIITVTRAMALGERTARVGPVRAPAELRELATAFDRMADTLDRQEQLRRGLVADVAHELRTPIAVLQAGHEALLDGVAEPTPEQLGSLRDETLRLARMVNDLQNLAAADAAALQLSRHRCDLAKIAATAADSLGAQFDAAGLTLEQRLTPVEIYADEHWLHQVTTNLLTNACKYTPAGGFVTIEAGPAESSEQTTSSVQTAILRVTDTGPGIPADELPMIFDRFWRGQQAGQTSGSGIGLAVASEIAHAHGGELAADSLPGYGTRMTLTLPRV
ncbi:MAG TPA: HAMP domain-containing sensor histidine kinase [Streptosporangiaceae bacterium]|nr:HAMP domain-containing sensor histidine kinase [Streptosporangiaceae bacterium]